MVPEYYVWKLWCGGVKIKTLHRNSPVQSGAGFKAIVCVRVCVHAHAGWWSTASCQHHRDTALIGTRGASVHHRQACWLNSLALKGPSHQNFHLLFSFADHLLFFFFSSAQVENLAQTQVSSTKLCFSKRTCTQMFVISPFHTHLTNDEWGDAFKTKAIFPQW